MYKVLIERLQLTELAFTQEEFDEWMEYQDGAWATHEGYAQMLADNIDENEQNWITSAILSLGVIV